MNQAGCRCDTHIASRLSFLGALMLSILVTASHGAAPGQPEKDPHEGEPVKKYPFVIYSESDSAAPPPYVPSGWMGNHQVIDYEDNWTKQPRFGKSCIRFKCKKSSKWFGVVWQSPANDWGNVEGGYNLSGARQLTFWARGHNGGEKVEFKFGILRDNQDFPDSTGSKAKNVTLTRNWRKYSIPVSGDKKCIKTGFVFAVKKCNEDFTFYLDNIQYE